MSAYEESTLRKAAKKTLVEYFQKTSLNGFGLLYYIRRRKYQRSFWFMFILLGLGFAAYVVLFTLIHFLQEPTVTSLISQYQPIWGVPFPAVAICSVNKLSLRSAGEHMRQIVRYDAIADWMESMQWFAGFFDIYAVADHNETVEFPKNLFDGAANNQYVFPALLRKISPSCQQLLIQCRWSGQFQNCADLFNLQTTESGNCCLFNWQFEAIDKSSFPLLYPNGTSSDMGLTVLLNTSAADYFYADRSTNGFILRILEPRDFLDTIAGGAQELIVSTEEHVKIELSLTTQITTTEVREYTVAQRRCYFADEYDAQQLAMGDYSQGNCLSKCKIQSIVTQCGCVPYYKPINSADYIYWNANTNTAYCSFVNFKCLQERDETWQRFHSLGMNSFGKLEIDDALCTSKCLPLCSYNRYSYRKRKSRLHNTEATQFLFVFKRYANCPVATQYSNLSMVTLYFPTPHATGYRKNVSYNWYQILSNIGGVIGICMGCSLISGFEIVYFLAFRFFLHFYKQCM